MLTSEDIELRLCIIVEAVHATAESWPELRSYCIEPLLRVLAEGEEGKKRPEISLIAYHADGGTPAASLDALPWTTDVNAIRQALDELQLRFFVGGGNAGPALAEALWECLHMFSWQSNIKKRPGADEGGVADRKATARDHALLIACTEASRATPHLPHLGQSGDPLKLSNALLDIAQMFPRRSISLTVVWPKKPESRSPGALPEVCMLGLKAAPRQAGEAGVQNGNQQQQQQPRRAVVSLPSQLSSVDSWKVMVSPIAPLLKRVFDEVRVTLRPEVSNRAQVAGAAPVLAASPASTTPKQQGQPVAAAPLPVMPTTATSAPPAPTMPAGLNLMQQQALSLPQQAAPRPPSVRADALGLGRGGRLLAAQQQPAGPPASSAAAVPYLPAPAPQLPQAAAHVPPAAAQASASSVRSELEMVWMGGLCTVTAAGHDVALMQVAAYQKRGSAAERPALPTRLVVEASISEKCVKQLMTSSSARSRHPRVLEARVLANTVTPDGQVVLKKLLGRQQHLIFTMPRQHVVLLFSSPSHGSLVLVPKQSAAGAAASSAGVATESQRPGARPQAAAHAPRPAPLLP